MAPYSPLVSVRASVSWPWAASGETSRRSARGVVSGAIASGRLDSVRSCWRDRDLERWNRNADNLTIHETDSQRAMTHLPFEMPNDAHDDPFDLEGIGVFDDDRLHHVVGRLELDHATLAAIGLDRRLPIHEGNDGLAVSDRRLFLDDDHVSGKDPLIPHRLAFHPQGKGLATPDHALGNFHGLGLWNRLNGRSGGHDPSYLQMPPDQIEQGDFRQARDTATPVFIANDRAPCSFELFGKLVLCEAEELTGLTELGRPHSDQWSHMPKEPVKVAGPGAASGEPATD